jgi:hypothetical protein
MYEAGLAISLHDIVQPWAQYIAQRIAELIEAYPEVVPPLLCAVVSKLFNNAGQAWDRSGN